MCAANFLSNLDITELKKKKTQKTVDEMEVPGYSYFPLPEETTTVKWVFIIIIYSFIILQHDYVLKFYSFHALNFI